MTEFIYTFSGGFILGLIIGDRFKIRSNPPAYILFAICTFPVFVLLPSTVFLLFNVFGDTEHIVRQGFIEITFRFIPWPQIAWLGFFLAYLYSTVIKFKIKKRRKINEDILDDLGLENNDELE